MGINIFALVPTNDADDTALVELLNEGFGGDDPESDFDWCDLFKGEGGHRLTVEQALAFEDEAAPWYVYNAAENRMYTTKDNREQWVSLVRAHNGPVIFIKARL